MLTMRPGEHAASSAEALFRAQELFTIARQKDDARAFLPDLARHEQPESPRSAGDDHDATRIGEAIAGSSQLQRNVAHFAFRAAAGAVYGATVGSRRASALTGIAYGLAVWALAYGVGLPSLGLHPAATDDTRDRNDVLIVSHVVWGASSDYCQDNAACSALIQHPRA